MKQFWWSQKQFDEMNANAMRCSLPEFAHSQPCEVLVNGEWCRYSGITSLIDDSDENDFKYDDIELVAELSHPIQIRVEGREVEYPA